MATTFDPRGKDFVFWASLMSELFAEQNLMKPTEDTDWKQWALGLVGNGYFAQYNVPLPDSFDNWEDWAERVLQSEIDPGAQ